MKPGDFFLGIIDFFGILVPGAFLLFLHRDALTIVTGNVDGSAYWVVFFLGSYVLGHFLSSISAELNPVLKVCWPEKKDQFFKAIKGEVQLPSGVEPTRRNYYYYTYAVVRNESESAITEIDRQAAEYKLLRSLAVIFFLEFVYVFLSGAHSAMLIWLPLFLLAGWRFLFLLHWTYRITFEHYYVLKLSPKAGAPSPSGQVNVESEQATTGKGLAATSLDG